MSTEGTTLHYQVQDEVQSLLAQTHAIQNRLLQAACKGSLSTNVLGEMERNLRSMCQRVQRMKDEANP